MTVEGAQLLVAREVKEEECVGACDVNSHSRGESSTVEETAWRMFVASAWVLCGLG